MIVEGYGGTCPVCGFTRMLIRYGSHGWYQFDACPRCGFAYGNSQTQEDKDPKDVWKGVLETDSSLLKHRGFPVSIEGMYRMVMSMSEPPREFRKTVFYYPKKWIEDFKKSKLYKQRTKLLKERVIFS